MTQYTVLIPKLVKASKMQDRTRLEIVELTKYNPKVTAPATSKLKTAQKALVVFFLDFFFWGCLPKKNLAPNRCTHRGNQKLVGIQAKPMIKVWRKTESAMGSPQNSWCEAVVEFGGTTTDETSQTVALSLG
jgi:hypothetical protein